MSVDRTSAARLSFSWRHQYWMPLVLILVVPLATAFAAEWIDPKLGTDDGGHQLVWYDIRQLMVEGQGWKETLAPFDRLPGHAQSIVRPEVWKLSRQSSGICVRFVTDAQSLHAEWSLGLERLSEWNMTAAAISGLDLYVRHEGQWRWLVAGKPEKQFNRHQLFHEIPAGEREFLLYLPLYNVVQSARLGIPRSARIKPAERRADTTKPIVIYGTSITQGGCASRPGMVYSAILGRRLDREVINLGFRANGTMDHELAQLCAELDPAIYILDCLPNLTAPEILERTEPFVATLRARHPQTPIVLCEDRTYPDGFLNRPRAERNQTSRAALKVVYQRLQQRGTANLYYLEGAELLDHDGEATVDASHPTDAGFIRMADKFEPLSFGVHDSNTSSVSGTFRSQTKTR